MRVLRVARSSARKGRTQALNQMAQPGLDRARPHPGPSSGASASSTSWSGPRAIGPGAKRDIVSLTKFHTSDVGPARHHHRRGRSPRSTPSLKPLVQRDLRPEFGPPPSASERTPASALLVAAGDNPRAPPQRGGPSPTSAAPRRSTPAVARTNDNRLNRSGDPPGQLGPLAHRAHPYGLRPSNHRVHRSTQDGRPDQEGGDSLPQALRRSRGVQPPTSRQTGA